MDACHPVRSLVALVLTCALVAGACGGADREAADGVAGDPSATEDTPLEDVPSDDEPSEDASGEGQADESASAGDAAAAGSEAGAVPMFGDAPWPCGPGDASGATAQGVTDDTIVIGAGDDQGFASSPGLNAQMTAAAQAMVDACNELGGIEGRRIELIRYDAKIFEVSTVMLEACDDVFMLVGEGFAVDGFGEETRVQCELAHIPAWTVSAAAAHGPRMVQPMPNPADQLSVGAATYIAENHPEAIDVAVAIFANFGATIETKDKGVAGFAQVGYEWLGEIEYNVNGEEDWTPFVLRLRDLGAELVYFTGTCLPNYQQFRAAAAVNDFDAVWQVDNPWYDAPCAAANADGVMDGTLIRVPIVPFEERAINPATDDYMTLMENAGEDISALAVQTVSAFLLWATAASACGSDLTADCVLDQARSIGTWDGHGLHVPTDPGANDAATCVVVMELVGTAFRRVHPPEPGTFACDPASRVEIATTWSDEARLDDDRVSQQFTG